MDGVLDSMPMFLIYNLFLWPLGLAFMGSLFLIVFLPLLIDIVKDIVKSKSN